MPIGQPVQLRFLKSCDDPLLDEVKRLGDARSNRVGHLPYAAYDQFAASSRILIAEANGKLLGYTCFSLPRGFVKIVHVCVAPGRERAGIARQLVEQVSTEHRDRRGILAKCRNDYNLQAFWQSLGFSKTGELRGRGKDRLPLTTWWKDHDHHTLFNLPPEPTLLAAIDYNVFLDLFVNQKRSTARRSRWLTDASVSSQIEIAITKELQHEFARSSTRVDVKRYTSLIQEHGIRELKTNSSRVETHYKELVERIEKILPGYPRTEQDISDIRHIAETAASKASVFITLDQNIISKIGPVAAEILDISILSPEDVLLHLDELANSQAYRPARLEGTGIGQARGGAGSEQQLLTFLRNDAGEKRKEYCALIRDLMAQKSVFIVHDSTGISTACYAYRLAGETVLEVPLIRVLDGQYSLTLARHLLFELRRQCKNRGLRVIRILDAFASPVVREAARYDGFRFDGQHPRALVISTYGTAADAASEIACAVAEAGIHETLSIQSNLSAIRAAELERLMWPLKLIDSQLPSYIVPIRAKWSSRLFNDPEPLEARSTPLGLSREHVYYNSGKPRLKAPGRILWYRSGPEHGGGLIFACSRLDATVIATPEVTFSRFGNIGVLSLKDVIDVASGGTVQALYFADTEILPHPVSLRTYQTLAGARRRNETFPCARLIDSNVFMKVYEHSHR